MHPTVVASWIRAVLEFAASEGLDVVWLCERAALSKEMLEHPDHRVPHARHLALWQALQELVSDPSFGLRMGLASASARSLDALGYLLRSSVTLGEAFRRLERYGRLVNEAAIQKLEVKEDGVVMVDGPLHGPPWPPLYSDQVAAAYFTFMSQWTGLELRGMRIELPQPAPDCQPTPHEEIFGDRVEFDATRLAIFPTGSWSVRL